MNNWTIWCTQNVLLSVFLSDTEEEIKKKVFYKACRSIDYFLEEYGEDGCCDEGANYYRHAGLCLFNSIHILNGVTGDFFLPMYREEKIKNIASYILNAHIDDEYYVNFADCSPIAGRAGVREYLFAKYTENPKMQQFAALDYQKGGVDTLLLPGENNLYYRLQNGFTVSEILAYAEKYKNQPISHKDFYYPSVGLFIARDERLYLAVKAGDNDDSHNHNDTGSFTVYKDGKPFLIDVGVESYTKKTFSPRRYEIWTMQSDYHNLPTLNGYMQQNGPEFKAQGVSYELGEEYGKIEMDLVKAYPDAAGIRSYVRCAELFKGSHILIKDRYEADREGEIVLHLMTYEKPVIKEASHGLDFRIGDMGSIHLENYSLVGVDEIPIEDARLLLTWKHPIYRINVKLSAKEGVLRIE